MQNYVFVKTPYINYSHTFLLTLVIVNVTNLFPHTECIRMFPNI